MFYDFEYDLVLHRFICKEDNNFILKGDNSNTIDIIEFENILGKVDGNLHLKNLKQITTQYIKKVEEYNIIINIDSGELKSFSLTREGEKNNGGSNIS